MPVIYSQVGPIEKRYTSASSGWTAENGTGSATVSGGLRVALQTAETASSAYPDTNNPKYYRDISADIAGYADFDIWVRIVSATMGADQNIGIALNDAAGTVNGGICASTGTAGQLTAVPFASAGYVGAPAGTVALNGTGWLGVSRRGGIFTALGGTGTASVPPTQYASCMTVPNSSVGYSLPVRFTIWAQKYGGTDMNGVFDNVIIRCYV